MSEHESSLERLQSQLDRWPDRPSGLLDLAYGILGQDATPDERACALCQETLPDYIEAELNGQPVRHLYRKLAHHLDLCSSCGQVYIDLLELAIQADTENNPLPDQAPALDLSFLPPLSIAEQMRKVVESLSEALLRRHSPQFLSDLQAASHAFFRQLGELGAVPHFQRAPEFALAFGAGMPPALRSLTATYIATDQVVRSLSQQELADELSGARPPRTLRKRARAAARSMGFSRREANRWAEQYIASAQTHAADMQALALQATSEEG